MATAIVRVRGSQQAGGKVWRTLEELRLNKLNHMVILPTDKTTLGMLQVVKDYVTWGEISAEMIAKILLKKGEMPGGKIGINDDFIKKNSEKYKSILSFSKALDQNEARLTDVKDLQPVIRLHPPRGGYEAVKTSYRTGGSLGNRGKNMEALLERMIAPVGKE